MADDFGMGYALGQDSGGGNGMFGGDGWIGLIIFAMIFGGGWGNGGMLGGGNGALTRAELYDGFTLNNLEGGQRDLAAQLANCCCENREAIAQVRYDMATQFCETRRSIQDLGRELFDYLTQQEMSKMRDEIQTLKFADSQRSQNQFITQVGNEIVNRLQPNPVPAYMVQNPYAGYGWAGTFGYGGSCYGNGYGCGGCC